MDLHVHASSLILSLWHTRFIFVRKILILKSKAFGRCRVLYGHLMNAALKKELTLKFDMVHIYIVFFATERKYKKYKK